MKKSLLLLISILCVAVMLFGVLTGCQRDNREDPGDGKIDDSFFGVPSGPTGDLSDDPTGGNTNGDSTVMDGEVDDDDYMGMPVG